MTRITSYIALISVLAAALAPTVYTVQALA